MNCEKLKKFVKRTFLKKKKQKKGTKIYNYNIYT